jgi:tetratricopeptide (TPR) repeat protein
MGIAVLLAGLLLAQEPELATVRPGERLSGEIPAGAETAETPALIEATGDAVPAAAVLLVVETEGEVVLELVSHTFDAYLVVRADEETVVGESGGGGVSTHARLAVSLAPGEYRVEACAFDGAYGPFELAVGEGTPEPSPEERAELELADARTAVATLRELRPGSDREAGALARLVALLGERGLEAETRAPLERLLEIFEVNGQGLDAARTALLLARVSQGLGFTADAHESARRAVALFDEELGPDSLETAQARSLLGVAAYSTGRVEEAADHLARALDALREEAGPAAPATLATLADLSTALTSLGRLSEARRRDEGLLPEVRRALGRTALETRDLLERLGDVAHRVADLPAARAYLEELIASTLDPTAESVDADRGAGALRDLGWVLREQGDDRAAAERFEEALDLLDGTRAADDLESLDCAFDLALARAAAGEDAAAERALARALSGFERVLGRATPRAADARLELARLEERRGRIEPAGQLIERAADDLGESLGREHPRTLVAALAAAELEGRHGDARSAAERTQALVPRLVRALGESHPRVGLARVRLGRLLARTGDAPTALVQLRAGRDGLLAALGPGHAESIRAAIALAETLDLAGNRDEARTLLVEDLASRPPTRLDAFEHATSRDRFDALAAEREELDLLLTLDPDASDPSVTGTPLDLDAYEAFARWRAYRHSTRLETRRHVMARAGDEAPTLLELARVRTRLARLGRSLEAAPLPTGPTGAATPASSAVGEEGAGELLELARELSARLARRLGAPEARLPFEKLAWNLPDDSALVDFAVVRIRGARGADTARGEAELFAWITRDEPASLQAVRLGPIAPIAAAAEELVGSIRSRDAEGFASAGRRLRDLVWQPVEERLGTERRVLMVPGALLAGVPFEALPSAPPAPLPGSGEPEEAEAPGLLIEERAFTYVVDPSRLVVAREAVADEEPGTLLLAGGVDPAEASVRPGGAGLRPLSEPRVVAGLFELEAVAGLHAEVVGRDGRRRELYGGGATLELLLAELPEARTVHLSLPLFGASRAEAWPPARRCGLGTADVVLEAGELAALDLAGVELAVLTGTSAGCLLDAVQALQSAGVGDVVAARWPPGRGAAPLLEAFYRALWAGEPVERALRQARLELLREGREADGTPHPERWAAFLVVPAGP